MSVDRFKDLHGEGYNPEKMLREQVQQLTQQNVMLQNISSSARRRESPS